MATVDLRFRSGTMLSVVGNLLLREGVRFERLVSAPFADGYDVFGHPVHLPLGWERMSIDEFSDYIRPSIVRLAQRIAGWDVCVELPAETMPPGASQLRDRFHSISLRMAMTNSHQRCGLEIIIAGKSSVADAFRLASFDHDGDWMAFRREHRFHGYLPKAWHLS